MSFTSTMHNPEDYEKEFDPDAYFDHYFGKKSIEDGTRVSLFCLPVFAEMLKQSLPSDKEPNLSLLDIGAGPTIYSAMCFRNIVNRVYLTDFLDKNLTSLKVDIVVTVFCLESACKTIEEYRAALRNIVVYLKKGGRFIIGSVIDDNIYNAGNQRMFWLLRLSVDDVMSSLESVGLDVSNAKIYTLEGEGVMFAMLTKF